MSCLIELRWRRIVPIVKQSALLVALSICTMNTVSADDIAVSEKSFGCIVDWKQIRNTHIANSDPERLKEAIRIFRDSVPEISISDRYHSAARSI